MLFYKWYKEKDILLFFINYMPINILLTVFQLSMHTYSAKKRIGFIKLIYQYYYVFARIIPNLLKISLLLKINVTYDLCLHQRRL